MNDKTMLYNIHVRPRGSHEFITPYRDLDSEGLDEAMHLILDEMMEWNVDQYYIACYRDGDDIHDIEK